MSIALISANFGGTDIHPEPRQDGVEYKRFNFNEKNTPFPMPNLPPRLKELYFKLQSHRIPALKEFYIHCWAGPEFKIVSPDFLQHTASQLDEYYDIAIDPHPLRGCLYEEASFLSFSQNQSIREEVEFYWSNGMPEKYGLWECGIFMRDVTKTSELFDQWWDLCFQWSYFDQISFPFLAWKHKPAITRIKAGEHLSNKYFLRS